MQFFNENVLDSIRNFTLNSEVETIVDPDLHIKLSEEIIRTLKITSKTNKDYVTNAFLRHIGPDSTVTISLKEQLQRIYNYLMQENVKETVKNRICNDIIEDIGGCTYGLQIRADSACKSLNAPESITHLLAEVFFSGAELFATDTSYKVLKTYGIQLGQHIHFVQYVLHLLKTKYNFPVRTYLEHDPVFDLMRRSQILQGRIEEIVDKEFFIQINDKFAPFQVFLKLKELIINTLTSHFQYNSAQNYTLIMQNEFYNFLNGLVDNTLNRDELFIFEHPDYSNCDLSIEQLVAQTKIDINWNYFYDKLLNQLLDKDYFTFSPEIKNITKTLLTGELPDNIELLFQNSNFITPKEFKAFIHSLSLSNDIQQTIYGLFISSYRDCNENRIFSAFYELVTLMIHDNNFIEILAPTYQQIIRTNHCPIEIILDRYFTRSIEKHDNAHVTAFLFTLTFLEDARRNNILTNEVYLNALLLAIKNGFQGFDAMFSIMQTNGINISQALQKSSNPECKNILFLTTNIVVLNTLLDELLNHEDDLYIFMNQKNIFNKNLIQHLFFENPDILVQVLQKLKNANWVHLPAIMLESELFLLSSDLKPHVFNAIFLLIEDFELEARRQFYLQQNSDNEISLSLVYTDEPNIALKLLHAMVRDLNHAELLETLTPIYEKLKFQSELLGSYDNSYQEQSLYLLQMIEIALKLAKMTQTAPQGTICGWDRLFKKYILETDSNKQLSFLNKWQRFLGNPRINAFASLHESDSEDELTQSDSEENISLASQTIFQVERKRGRDNDSEEEKNDSVKRINNNQG